MHTIGNWYTDKTQNGYVIRTNALITKASVNKSISRIGVAICYIQKTNTLPEDQHMANAALISAAPEGLALAELVLTAVWQGHPIHPKIVETAQFLVAKVTGKP